tara:strand:- start:382 stop:630 length:249 start_codon:yes stop_codon:yes gene_type:complete
LEGIDMKMKLTKRHLRKIIKEEISKIVEEEKDDYEGRPLEAPLAESFELEQMDEISGRLTQTRRELHNVIMWAIEQGYSPKR